MKQYKPIIDHYEQCFQTHGDTHLGMDWPNLEDTEKRYKVMLALMGKDTTSTSSLLDFGCGTSHLLEYIKREQIPHIDYSGLDISSSFIDVARKKFPEVTYYNLDVLEAKEAWPKFDYIVCNGVFTEKRDLSFEAMWDYTQELLTVLFEKAHKGIAFNVMSKAVDWERWDLFHLPTDVLIDFMTKDLSRNFVIRNDYGLYEYTVYLYK